MFILGPCATEADWNKPDLSGKVFRVLVERPYPHFATVTVPNENGLSLAKFEDQLAVAISGSPYFILCRPGPDGNLTAQPGDFFASEASAQAAFELCRTKALARLKALSDHVVLANLQPKGPLGRLRKRFSSESGQIEQAGAQRRSLNPIELCRMELAASIQIAADLGIILMPENPGKD